jgi:hypothetical protein
MPNTTTIAHKRGRISRLVEYIAYGCLSVAALAFLYHEVGRQHVIRERVERVSAGCLKVVTAAATQIAAKHPETKWSTGKVSVLGDLESEGPDSNSCSVAMTFQIGPEVDREVWLAADTSGYFGMLSARFMGVETVQ